MSVRLNMLYRNPGPNGVGLCNYLKLPQKLKQLNYSFTPGI